MCPPSGLPLPFPRLRKSCCAAHLNSASLVHVVGTLRGGRGSRFLSYRAWEIVAVKRPSLMRDQQHLHGTLQHHHPHYHRHRYPKFAVHPNASTKSTQPTTLADLLNFRLLDPNHHPTKPISSDPHPEAHSPIHHRIESHPIIYMNLTHILPPKDPPRLVRLPGPAADEEEEFEPDADVLLQEETNSGIA